MTKTRSNRNRHRRGRDRSPESVMPGQAPGEVAVEQSPAAQAAPVIDQPAVSTREQGPSRRPMDNPRNQRPAPDRGPVGRGGISAPGDQPGGQRSGPPRGNRRRPPRRPQVAPMPNQVLKHKAPITGPTGPVAKRRLEDISGPDGPKLGCPMLTRTRIGLPVTGGQRAPRCSLAWAIHSETEATYCMETHDATLCWQAHPERLDEVRARLDEQRERAAD